MNIFSLLSLLAFMVYMHLGLHAYHLDPKSRLNRLLLVVCLNLSCWTFAYSFVYSAPNKEVLWFWFRISSIGWCFFGGITLHFLMVLSQKDRWLKKWWLYLLLYGPGLIFTLKAWTGIITAKDFIATPLGWVEVGAPESPWFWLHFTYYTTCILLGCVLAFLWGYRSMILREKKQGYIVGGTILAAFILGSFINVAIPVLHKTLLPAIAPILGLVWASGIWQAMTRYRFMGLSPAVLGEEIIDRTKELLILVNPDGNIIKANRQARALLGYPEKELIGEPFNKVILNKEIIQEIQMRLDGSLLPLPAREIAFRTQQGEIIPVELYCSLIRDDLGDGLGLLLVGEDMRPMLQLKEEILNRKRVEEALLNTQEELELRIQERTDELYQANTALKELAYFDPLTGLPNRSLFFDRLKQALAKAQRNKSDLTLMMLDLDHFKAVNDTFGHSFGDALLQEVGIRITRLLRKSDTVARLGGDEFMILLPDTGKENDVGRIAEKILEVTQEPFDLDGQQLRSTVSIGVAFYPTDGDSPDVLIKNADYAMYQVKEKCKNDYQFYSTLAQEEEILRQALIQKKKGD
jgi:diguanylate cyclase (GGDEF)-like protein/PAS domain S-box-containing protein